MGNNYFEKEYKLSQKVRELIESKRGKQVDLSYVQIERILISIYRNEYTQMIHSFTQQDKERLMSTIKSNSVNSINEKGLITLSLFLKDNFTEEEIKVYVDYLLLMNYHPGSTYLGIKINNDNIIKFIELLGVYESLDCIILLKKYINDIIIFLDKKESDYIYDKTSLIIEEDLTQLYIDKVNEIKLLYNIEYSNNDDLFIISANNEESLNFLKNTYKELKIEKYPKQLFI